MVFQKFQIRENDLLVGGGVQKLHQLKSITRKGRKRIMETNGHGLFVIKTT
jgi:hypothetical protein